MDFWHRMAFPMQKAWIRVAKRLGIRKTGLVKLRHDVRTCEYEDVHILWDMLKKNDSRLAGSDRKGRFWRCMRWAGRASCFCCSV